MRGWFIRIGLPLAPLSVLLALAALEPVLMRRCGVWERLARVCNQRLSRLRGLFRPTVAQVVVVAVPTHVAIVLAVTVRAGVAVAAVVVAGVEVAVPALVGTCTPPQLIAASNPGST